MGVAVPTPLCYWGCYYDDDVGGEGPHAWSVISYVSAVITIVIHGGGEARHENKPQQSSEEVKTQLWKDRDPHLLTQWGKAMPAAGPSVKNTF